MKMARKIEGGAEVGLPKIGTLSDGKTVSNYDQLPPDVLKAEGWLPFEDVKPEVPEGKYANHTSYDFKKSKIVAVYEVFDSPVTEPVVDPVKVLEDAVMELTMLIMGGAQ